MTLNGSVLLAVGLGASGMWYLGRPEAAVVVFTAALLLLVALAWRLFLAQSCEPSLNLVPARIRRGDAVEVHASAWPRWRWDRGQVRCRAKLLGADVEFSLPITRAAPVRDLVPASHRGVFRSTIVYGERIGPFALARRVVHGSPVVETTVLPKLYDFAAPRRHVNIDDGPPATGPDGPVFASLREYVPGDDIRLIHWAASARTPDGSLLVRQHVTARAPAFRVILDPDAGDDAARFEDCVDITYSLVHAMRSAVGRSVEVSTAVGGVVVTRSDRGRVDDLLLHVQPCGRHPQAGAPCRAALDRMACRNHVGGVTTVIVSTAEPIRTRLPPGPTIHFRVGSPERIRRLGRYVLVDVPDPVAAARAWASVEAR